MTSAELINASLSRVWGLRESVLAFVLTFLASVGAVYKVAWFDGQVQGGVVWPSDAITLVILVLALVLLIRDFVLTRATTVIPDGVAIVFCVVLLAALLLFNARYLGRWEGTADSAAALDVGIREILAGRDPYLAETFLGNRVSPMPGGFIMAAPFYLVFGSSGVQTIAWLIVAVIFVFRVAGARGALAFVALLIASPVIRLNLVTQFDHLAIAVVLLISGSVGYFACRSRPGWASTLTLFASAVVFGIAVADRFIYAVALVSLAAVIWRDSARSRAIWWVASVLGCAAVVALFPLVRNADSYLQGPVALGLDKASGGQSMVSTVMLIAIGLAVLAIVTWRVRTLADVWLGSALVLAAVMIANVVSIGLGEDWFDAMTRYVAVDYNGAWLVLGLAGLVLPRTLSFGVGMWPVPVGSSPAEMASSRKGDQLLAHERRDQGDAA